MKELEFITLENGNNYFKLSELDFQSFKYYLLVNSKDKDDFVIRKEIDEYLIGLDNTEELKDVINEFAKNNIDILLN